MFMKWYSVVFTLILWVLIGVIVFRTTSERIYIFYVIGFMVIIKNCLMKPHPYFSGLIHWFMWLEKK